MVKVTVKTLNSACHEFDLEEGSTVEQLKALIQEKVDIEPARQRLIFLGKVLQNDKLLSEYNVEGKVIHLVESQVPRSRGDGAESSGASAATTAPADDTLHQATINITNPAGTGPEQIGQQMIEQILSSLGVDATQANIHRTALNDGQTLQMSIAIPQRDDQFQVHIVNETTGARRASLPSNTASTGTTTSTTTATTTAGATAPGAPPATAGAPALAPATGGAGHATGAPGTAPAGAAPAGAAPRARGRGAPGLDSILNNLRAVRESMRHIPCTSNNDLINNVLQAPCIRAPYTRGPGLGEEGATQEQVDQRATSRESLETYSHILIDLADIQLEMVRYMNQYARLLHHDPPLDGPGLVHAENLANRMATSFHSLAHAYHLLSDFGISFSQPPPRRLWMAQVQLTGASVVVQNTQNNIRHQINLVRGLAPAGVTGPTARFAATRAHIPATGTFPAPGMVPGAVPRPVPGAVPRAPPGAPGARPAAAAPGARPGAAPARPPPGLPAGAIPNMQNMFANIAAAQEIAGEVAGAAGAMNAMRPSLPCNSRHRLYQERCTSLNCPQRGTRPPGGHAHGHGHSHAHGGHGHSHTHATANGGFPPTRPTPPPPAAPVVPAQLGNLATVLNMMNTTSGTDDTANQAAQAQALQNFLMNVLLNPQAQSQPIAAHWSHIRALLEVLMPDSSFTCPENSEIGAFFSIIGHQFNITQLTDFSRGNNALFDQVYQPLRAHYLSSLFNNASPTEAQVDTAVDNILRDERDMIIQLHDSSNGDSELNQEETVIRIFGELFRTVFKDLMRRDNPSGFGESFSTAVQRSLALYMAFSRRNNVGRSGLDQQIMAILESQAFIQNLPTVTEEEVERYLVRVEEEEEEEDQMSADEYVDAEENGFHKEEEEERKRRESITYLLDDDNFMDDASVDSERVLNNDELDDLELEPVVRTPAPAARGRGAAAGPVVDVAVVPDEWKSVIEGDQEKLRTASYPPLSDGYLDWIPAKRRRVVNKTKRSTKPAQVLDELVQRSVPTGSEIKTEEHPEVGTLFRSQLREDLAKRLRDNSDLDENRYPAAAKIKKSNT